MKYVITIFEIENGDIPGVSDAYGPFDSHQEANAAMQSMFDEYQDDPDFEDAEFDDSNADHFEITTESDRGDYKVIHFMISELVEIKD